MNLIEAKKLAESLMKEHLTPPEQLTSEKYRFEETLWKFKFDKSKSRFGVCRYYDKTISMSRRLTELNEEKDVRNVILHEIAHALTPGEHHNRRWQLVAKRIGCDGKRCYDSTKVKVPTKKFLGECPACHRKIYRHARRKIACGACCQGKFNSAYLFEWSILKE